MRRQGLNEPFLSALANNDTQLRQLFLLFFQKAVVAGAFGLERYGYKELLPGHGAGNKTLVKNTLMGRMLIDYKKPVAFFHQDKKPEKPPQITDPSF